MSYLMFEPLSLFWWFTCGALLSQWWHELSSYNEVSFPFRTHDGFELFTLVMLFHSFRRISFSAIKDSSSIVQEKQHLHGAESMWGLWHFCFIIRFDCTRCSAWTRYLWHGPGSLESGRRWAISHLLTHGDEPATSSHWSSVGTKYRIIYNLALLCTPLWTETFGDSSQLLSNAGRLCTCFLV